MRRDLVAAANSLEDCVRNLDYYQLRRRWLGAQNLTQNCSIGNLSRYVMVLSAIVYAQMQP